MFKKILSSILCSLVALPILSCMMPVSAAEQSSNDMIIGEWMWGSTIADLGADGAEKIMTRCAEMGVTDVYLLVKGTGGKLGYLKTQYKNALSRTNRDILQEAIDAAHARGIRLHAWICNMEDAYYKSQHNEAGMWHYIRARDNDRINLYDAGYREYMCNIAAELAAYDIDGLHFDYIRYNHLANGWSEVDIAALKQMGANIDRVKELVEITFGYHGRTANSSYIFNEYKKGDPDARIVAEYRRKNVREYAKAVIDAAKAVNPGLIISAATMPEGAYDDTSFADLHYGQSYDDTAQLYDYICPMGYSSSYGKTDTWIITLTKNSIDKGNKVVMGLQAYETATSARIMSEISRLKALSKDAKYGESTLGAVIFRTGTVDHAKLTYDTQNKMITVKLFNVDVAQSCRQIKIECAKGISITNAQVGPEFNKNTSIKISSNGGTVNVTGTNIMNSKKNCYVYLKYEGEISSDTAPAQVSISRLSDMCTYTVCYDVTHPNADIGTPPSFEQTEPEHVITTTPAPEITTAPAPETTPVETTAVTEPWETEPPKATGCGATAAAGWLACLIPSAVYLGKRKTRQE